MRGRILIYDPSLTFDDRASQAESRGFFDEDDRPPWDTWIAYIVGDPVEGEPWLLNGYLLAWVPRSMEAFANAGIEVNPVGCIQWMHSCRSQFIDDLRNRLGLD
jgi:hypothetical protein